MIVAKIIKTNPTRKGKSPAAGVPLLKSFSFTPPQQKIPPVPNRNRLLTKSLLFTFDPLNPWDFYVSFGNALGLKCLISLLF